MAAINEFLDYRKGDAFGLTFFGNNVLHWVPLTSDPSAIRCSPPFMRPEIAPPWFGGTMIGKALLACRQVLTSREEGDRMIVLVSDGDSFDLGNGNDEELAATLAADNITVYGIHIGGGDAPEPIVNITALTGGEVFQPGDRAGLIAVFQRIDAMRQTELEKVAAESMDYFLPYALVGLSLVGFGTLSLFGLRYTPW
jgi:Ca-activated chloride channel family protein